MDPIFERIKPGGGIEIPKQMMKSLHLTVGEEIELRVKDRKLLIEPHKDPVDELTGSISLKDPKIIDEIIESEDWL